MRLHCGYCGVVTQCDGDRWRRSERPFPFESTCWACALDRNLGRTLPHEDVLAR